MKAIITDIEGTTTSISFVHDELFPYARVHMETFVRENQYESEVRKTLLDIDEDGDLDRIVQKLNQWMAEDRKITSLKTLQGLLWEDGYKRGIFKTHLYEEVYSCLKVWKEKGIALYVYSSGSVHAHKLLFSHSSFGDLTPLFSGFFDTKIGSKRDPSSYVAIANTLQLPPNEIFFLSDIAEELDAAESAGISTYLVCREGRPERSQHSVVTNFTQIQINRSLL